MFFWLFYKGFVVPMLHGLQGTVIGMLLDPTPSFCIINAIITAMFDFCILRILQLNVAKWNQRILGFQGFEEFITQSISKGTYALG